MTAPFVGPVLSRSPTLVYNPLHLLSSLILSLVSVGLCKLCLKRIFTAAVCNKAAVFISDLKSCFWNELGVSYKTFFFFKR